MARHLALGKRGEDIAAAELKRRRYRIIERNYRCTSGEVDIIALHEKVIVFVEVKARSSRAYGRPEMSVTPRKQRQLAKVALSYLQSKNFLDRDARFDVVAVEVGATGERVRVIENAFELEATV